MTPMPRFPGGVWAVDFEYTQPPGHHPRTICMVAREVETGRLIRFGEDELRAMTAAPFPVDESALILAYYSSAECSCFLELGWALPVHIIDLYVEFKVHTNGAATPCGNGLLGALFFYGLPAILASQKEAMRDLAIRGAPFTPQELSDLIDYCQTDVDALALLWQAMRPALDWSRALLRGRYMKAAARMEWTGIPVDAPLLHVISKQRNTLRQVLIDGVDAAYGVYDGTTFRTKRWLEWCARKGIPWPMRLTGRPDLEADTFKRLSKIHPTIAPMHELRATLSSLKKLGIVAGPDGRNRTLLGAFSTVTSRNSPKGKEFIFTYPSWLRSLIRPKDGFGLAYVDWSQQEFGIGAALSQDQNMMEAYVSGDPYLAFAKVAKAVPPDATLESHSAERERFKTCALAVQYRQEAASLGDAVGVLTDRDRALGVLPGGSIADGEYLLDHHHRAFSRYWQWSDGAVRAGMLTRTLTAAFGWPMRVTAATKWRTLANFPGQANGAEMLRLACIHATEHGVRVCAPVHDALLIEAPLPDLDDAVAKTQDAMRWASRQVLDGFELRSDAKLVRAPNRYVDKRGKGIWKLVMEFLGRT